MHANSRYLRGLMGLCAVLAVGGALAGEPFRDCAECPQMVVIPAGSFGMGSPTSEAERFGNEGPQHRVSVKSFALGRTEVTQDEWKAIMGANPSQIQECGGNCPVENVSWDDVQVFIKKLNAKTGKQYRLPSEAEWEYAARGDTISARYWGNNPDQACGYANVLDATAKAFLQANAPDMWKELEARGGAHNCTDGIITTAPVGSFKPNAFGLYDMIGNVSEWVADSYHEPYQGAPTDGSEWQGDGAKRVLRGGSGLSRPQGARAAGRGWSGAALRNGLIGFRLARTLP